MAYLDERWLTDIERTDIERLRGLTRERRNEEECVEELLRLHAGGALLRAKITREARRFARGVRAASSGVMQQFLSEYSFSSREGTALMCLAEAYLRTPDAPSLDALIRDKIVGVAWGRGSSNSSLLMSASHWSLFFSGRLLRDFGDERGVVISMRRLLKRLGEPVVRTAIGRAMSLLGGQFVLGETMTKALRRSASLRSRGYRFSFDMLGESARCDSDARTYLDSYVRALDTLSEFSQAGDTHENDGISVKLSALHSRYEYVKKSRVMEELVERIVFLARKARSANIPLTIDAEEATRSDMLLSILEAVIEDLNVDEPLDGSSGLATRWSGFGIVIQAYRTNALRSLDFIYGLANRLQRRIAVRLVKGAYWDYEIKHAQTLGLANYPVYTRKCSTDLSYLACARRLLSMRAGIFPQFGTHNAHSAAAILAYAESSGGWASAGSNFELQRIHGMGSTLHEDLRASYGGVSANGGACAGLAGVGTRIYAPVGEHEDLLAYLVRRMLENGANSSFVNQAMDKGISLSKLVIDPERALRASKDVSHPSVVLPPALFSPRCNSRGWDLNDTSSQADLLARVEPFLTNEYVGTCCIGDGAGEHKTEHATGRTAERTGEGKIARTTERTDSRAAKNGVTGFERLCYSPANGELVGRVMEAREEDIEIACRNARLAEEDWGSLAVEERARILERVADLYEEHSGELVALLAREAGKTLPDGVSEVREAVDFCRYYAQEARDIFGDAEAVRRRAGLGRVGLGLVVCISPWNFPLAIFTGQIAASLVCGNVVLAKPAEQTPLIASLALSLFSMAGLPKGILSCLYGSGERVGALLLSRARAEGVCFTGSTSTAKKIDEQLSGIGEGRAVFIAETGGINAMIVDSTALTEQVVRDVLISAFQSSGQRCSSLRLLFVQREVEERVHAMLVGACGELSLDLPWLASSDLGPVIDNDAKENIDEWCRDLSASKQARELFAGELPDFARAGGMARGEKGKGVGKGIGKGISNGAGRGFWVAPRIYHLDDMRYLTREVFGPVLHTVSYDGEEIEELVERINAMGFGLTLGIHSRIENRVSSFISRSRCGNIYVNRNQIGAIVGCQPFGGEGASGTGPKAGCRDILLRLSRMAGAGAGAGIGNGALSGSALFSSSGPRLSLRRLSSWRGLASPKVGLFDDEGLVTLRGLGSRRVFRDLLFRGMDLGTRDLHYAPTRLRILWKQVSSLSRTPMRSFAEFILARASDGYAADGILSGTTGERNQRYSAERGVIACLGCGGGSARVYGFSFTNLQVLFLQTLSCLAFGNRAVAYCASSAEGTEALAGTLAGALDIGKDLSSLQKIVGDGYLEFRSEATLRDSLQTSSDNESESMLTECAAALFDGDGASRSLYRAHLARLSGTRRILFSLEDDVSFLSTQRVVSEDTTASGGNASLLLATSGA